MSTGRPLVLPLFALIAGYLLQYLLAVPVPMLVPVGLFAGLLVVHRFSCEICFHMLLFLFWFTWGMTALAPQLDGIRNISGIEAFNGRQVGVEGVLKSRPSMTAEGQRLELQVERVFTDTAEYRANGILLVQVARGHGDWLAGDRIRCIAGVRVPRLFGLPNEFNYPRYLALHGYHATAWVKDAASVVLIRGAASSSYHTLIDRLAQKSQAVIRQTLPDKGQQGVVLALATGTQSEIPARLAMQYARSGVSHILSVSGFHVGVVTFVWVQLFTWLLLRWEWFALRVAVRRIALLSAVPLMLIYLLFTGAEPATVRSVLMLSAVVLALWSERETDTLDVLFTAAFLMLLVDPASLFDLSFQLSFLSLWGLIVVTPILVKPFERFTLQGWQRMLLLFCAASLAATLATMVPVLVVFHQASLTGVLANLVVVPLLGYGATVLATTAIPLTIVVPSAAWILLKPAGWLTGLSNQFVSWIAGIPVLHWYGLGAVDLIAAIALLAVISFVHSAKHKTGFTLVLISGCIVYHLFSAPAVDGKLRMNFLSVGHGDALLINLPDGRTMLVDGGGYLYETGRDFGERYLVPALHGLGVCKIDIMVLTHPHPDHLGGLPAVAEQFAVGEFWHGGCVTQGSDYQRLMQALQQQHTKVCNLKQGDQVLLAKGLTVMVMSASDEQDRLADANDASVVLLLKQDRFSALLMGDAGHEVEAHLLRKGIGSVSLLKVGHHGSRGSSSEEFLHAVRPQFAIVSVAADNRFGLPAPETVAGITRCGAQLYRTDQNGSIQVISDGNNFSISSLTADNKLVAAARRFVLTGSNLLR